jgi:hypothetical protein
VLVAFTVFGAHGAGRGAEREQAEGQAQDLLSVPFHDSLLLVDAAGSGF